eukprot:123925-Prorocentrum_minimum.AAC.2
MLDHSTTVCLLRATLQSRSLGGSRRNSTDCVEFATLSAEKGMDGGDKGAAAAAALLGALAASAVLRAALEALQRTEQTLRTEQQAAESSGEEGGRDNIAETSAVADGAARTAADAGGGAVLLGLHAAIKPLLSRSTTGEFNS